LRSAFDIGLALLVLLATAVPAWVVWRGRQKIPFLSAVEPNDRDASHSVRVSVILTALNEEQTIRPALQSLLALQYPNLEIIAINDRSSDGTGAVLDLLQTDHPQLKVIHIESLPAGWLGKCHALHQGAQIASGEYLLFTDADVHFEPSTLSRAIQYCTEKNLDHLTLVFGLIAHGLVLRLLLVSLGIGLFALYQPWQAANKQSKAYFGVGGFNLVRRKVYDACGGHEPLRLEILDDLALGKQIKQRGFKQAVLYGDALVALEWYPSLATLFRGLEKNSFAAMGFQKRQLFAAVSVTVLVHVWPWFAVVLTTGLEQLIYGFVLLAMVLVYGAFLAAFKWSWVSLIALPVLGLLEVALLLNAGFTVLFQRGVNWRGTHYSLTALRQAQQHTAQAAKPLKR
jgi:cellulose synthase/poly-beta-1,6-N-acetylglucosamine synthase-like glycosyltransferase